MSEVNEVQLSAGDARQRDVGRGIARINKLTIKKLNISEGDVIEITAKRTTSAIAWPAYTEDENQDIIRIDGFTRKNADAAINEYVVVRPAKVKTASSITLAPVDMRLNVDEDFTKFLKERLMERTLVKGDITLAMMQGHAIPFTVCETNPDGIVKVVAESQITILNDPIPNDASQKEQNSNPLVSSTEALREISDETFDKLIEVVMANFFFDWKQYKVEEIAKETGTNKELVQYTSVFLRGLILNNFAGDLSVSSFQRFLLDDYKYPQTKIDIVIRHFERNKSELRFTLMFKIIQDLNAKLEATTESGYFPAIATRLAELKELYGHVLDVCVKTGEDMNRLFQEKQRIEESDLRKQQHKRPLF